MRNFVIRESFIGKCPTVWPLLFIHCFYCKIIELVVFVMSLFKLFIFCWCPSSSIKVEIRTAAENMILFAVIYADENCFDFFFYDLDVIQM